MLRSKDRNRVCALAHRPTVPGTEVALAKLNGGTVFRFTSPKCSVHSDLPGGDDGTGTWWKVRWVRAGWDQL